MVKYRNNQRCGCIICVNGDLSGVVNPMLISMEMPLSCVVTTLEEDYGIHVTEKELEKHKDHIVREFFEEELIEEKLERIETESNIDSINYEIARLEVLEEEMRKDHKINTPAFSNAIKTKQKYIEMRMKIEGEDKTTMDINVLPDWIEKISDKENIKIVDQDLYEIAE